MRNFDPDTNEPGTEERSPQEGFGGGQRLLLSAIVVLLALFGYLYLFTDLITSHTVPLPATEAPVRKPLPRKGGTAGRSSSSQRPPIATPETPSAGLPAAAPARECEPVRSAAPVPATASAPVTPPPLSCRIQCGPFVSSRELRPAKALLRKAGLRVTMTPGPKRPTSMYRLFVATYPDATVAAHEEKKLRESTPDAFVLPADGAYDLFGGSYHEEKRARVMQEHLAARGVTTVFRQVTAPVPTRWLAASGELSQDAAKAVAEQLKKNGIACSMQKQER